MNPVPKALFDELKNENRNKNAEFRIKDYSFPILFSIIRQCLYCFKTSLRTIG